MTALAGLLLSPLIVWGGHRLAVTRTEDREAVPDARVLVPIAGGRLAHWQPVRTVLVEVASAAILAGLALHYGLSIKLALGSAYALLLVAIAYIDLEYRLVLNWFSYPGIVAALALSALWPGLGLQSAMLGAAVSFAIFLGLQLLGRGALGTGDTKLAVLIGAMRGLPTSLDALVAGIMFGGIGALFFLIVLRSGRKATIAYAPYLAAGAIASFFFLGP